MQKVRKAVILAAGQGTRLYPATRAQPKEMLPLGRRPAIAHVHDELAEFGAESLLIVTGRHKRAIEDHFDSFEENEENAPPIFYVRQSIPRGTADAIALAEPYTAGMPFVVALGDMIMSLRGGVLLHRMERALFDLKADIAIAVQSVPLCEVSRYGIVAPKGLTGNEAECASDPFLVEDIVEKPEVAEAPSRFAVAARYIFSPVIFDYIRRISPASNGEYQSTDAIRLLIQEGGKVCCVPIEPERGFHDVGNFESYFDAFITFAIHDEELGPEIRKRLAAKLAQFDEAPG